MAAFTIALVGAPDAGQAQLLEALTDNLKLYLRPVFVLLADPAASARCDLILLMGLGCQQSPGITALDQAIRLTLAQTGSAFEVLYGTTQARLAQALHALDKRLVKTSAAALSPRDPVEANPKPWLWSCDKCSDPQCEHTLLSQLLAQRATAP